MDKKKPSKKDTFFMITFVFMIMILVIWIFLNVIWGFLFLAPFIYPIIAAPIAFVLWKIVEKSYPSSNKSKK